MNWTRTYSYKWRNNNRFWWKCVLLLIAILSAILFFIIRGLKFPVMDMQTGADRMMEQVMILSPAWSFFIMIITAPTIPWSYLGRIVKGQIKVACLTFLERPQIRPFFPSFPLCRISLIFSPLLPSSLSLSSPSPNVLASPLSLSSLLWSHPFLSLLFYSFVSCLIFIPALRFSVPLLAATSLCSSRCTLEEVYSVLFRGKYR